MVCRQSSGPREKQCELFRKVVGRAVDEDSQVLFEQSAFLGRDVPLYVAPNPVLEGREPVPADLAKAANAVLADRPLAGAEAYREVNCRSNGTIKACLFVRPGTCDRAAGKSYDYQTLLLRYDL